jgi:hypothetical protein
MDHRISPRLAVRFAHGARRSGDDEKFFFQTALRISRRVRARVLIPFPLTEMRGMERRLAPHRCSLASPCEDAAPSGAPSRRLQPGAALRWRPLVVSFLASSWRPVVVPADGAPGLPVPCLRGTAAGAASRSAQTTPRESAPRRTGSLEYSPISRAPSSPRIRHLFCRSRGAEGLSEPVPARMRECAVRNRARPRLRVRRC